MSKIMIIGTTSMMIFHHRRELIMTLREEGHEVGVIAPQDDESKNLIALGVTLYPTAVETRGTSIKADSALLLNIVRTLRKVRPDVVLTFYTKTNIYGGIASRIVGIPYIENITGLGTALARPGRLHKLMLFLYRTAIKDASTVFFQNEQNREYFRENGLWDGPSTLLPGSGVSLKRFQPLEYLPEDVPTQFLYVGRLMKDKGISEYLDAARVIKERHPETVFHVVGPNTPEFEERVKEGVERGEIIYHGKVLDTVPFMKQSHVMVFPSFYPEGMANVLLESSASCRPVITTPLPGCGDAMEEGVTGLLVKAHSTESLVETLEQFLQLPYEKKREMGLAARRKMEREFDRQVIVNAYLKAIRKALQQ